MSVPLIDRAADYFQDLQSRIVKALEEVDGHRFREDSWQRPGGGGGRTRMLSEGRVFEKAGVGFSDVRGEFRPDMAGSLPGQGLDFRATGISLVLHPRNPYAPTVHANFRRIERGAAGWFGGGADLTPTYVNRDDAIHFHRTLKDATDRFDTSLFPRFKAWCDDYFFIPHRGEPRGVGGIFFDYLGAGAETTARQPVLTPPAPLESDSEQLFALVRGVGDEFLAAYLPILIRRCETPFAAEERRWQLIRRGRYVEFNLVYDRGTVFGLKTDGRVESILMSLPLEARWEYAHEPAEGSPEAQTLVDLRAKRNWAELSP